MKDLADFSDADLDQLRVAVLTEQERRARVAQLPEQLAAMACDAVAAGCDPAVLRAHVEDALTD